ncbi:MAG TPA: hypothetical protein VH593_34210 [Ktedonobacteraceae bacterium]
MDSKAEAVRGSPATIDEFSLFFGEGVVAGNLAIREIGGIWVRL